MSNDVSATQRVAVGCASQAEGTTCLKAQGPEGEGCLGNCELSIELWIGTWLEARRPTGVYCKDLHKGNGGLSWGCGNRTRKEGPGP